MILVQKYIRQIKNKIIINYIMEEIIKKYLIVGLFTIIIGRIVMELVFGFKKYVQKEKVDREYIDNPKKAMYVYLTLFISGVILHYSIENILFRNDSDFLSDWICRIICIEDRCKLICDTDI